MQENLKMFEGRSHEAESTVLPTVSGWVHDTLSEIPDACLKKPISFITFNPP